MHSIGNAQFSTQRLQLLLVGQIDSGACKQQVSLAHLGKGTQQGGVVFDWYELRYAGNKKRSGRDIETAAKVE